MWFEEVKEVLVAEDPDFRHLAEEHKRYDRELSDLGARKYLTEDEQRAEMELKKKKLAIKDKMLAIAAEYRRVHPK